MSYEKINWDFKPDKEPKQRTPQERYDQIQRITFPETATNTLGNIALTLIIGGSIGTMGHLEAVTLDGIATTTEAADQLRYE